MRRNFLAEADETCEDVEESELGSCSVFFELLRDLEPGLSPLVNFGCSKVSEMLAERPEPADGLLSGCLTLRWRRLSERRPVSLLAELDESESDEEPWPELSDEELEEEDEEEGEPTGEWPTGGRDRLSLWPLNL